MTLHFTSNAADIDEVSSQYTVVHEAAPKRRSGAYRNRFKRMMDVSLTALSLPVVVPLVFLMALLVAFDGRNPFFSQLRVGQNGRHFRMWKLRTMVHNADELLEDYLADNPAARQEWDATQKLKQDPRITLVGRILRKTSMDELPQLWNVLNGTMSLVGPRPMMVNQKSSYFGKAYFRLRPGITGPWQVSDRNECHFIDRVRYDDEYDRDLSFMTDVKLLLRTISVVARGTGY